MPLESMLSQPQPRVPLALRTKAYALSHYQPFRLASHKYYQLGEWYCSSTLQQFPGIVQVVLRGGIKQRCLPGISDLDYTVFVEPSHLSASFLRRFQKQYLKLKTLFPILGEVFVTSEKNWNLFAKTSPALITPFLPSTQMKPALSALERFELSHCYFLKAERSYFTWIQTGNSYHLIVFNKMLQRVNEYCHPHSAKAVSLTEEGLNPFIATLRLLHNTAMAAAHEVRKNSKISSRKESYGGRSETFNMLSEHCMDEFQAAFEGRLNTSTSFPFLVLDGEDFQTLLECHTVYLKTIRKRKLTVPPYFLLTAPMHECLNRVTDDSIKERLASYLNILPGYYIYSTSDSFAVCLQDFCESATVLGKNTGVSLPITAKLITSRMPTLEEVLSALKEVEIGFFV